MVDFTLTFLGDGTRRRAALIDKHGNEFPGLISVEEYPVGVNEAKRYIIHTAATIVLEKERHG